MQKALTLLTLALLSAAATFAQRTFPVKWEEKPQLHTIPPEYAKASAVFVLDERRTEFVKDEAEKEVYLYRTMHRIIHLSDEKGVESFNRFSLPTGNTTRMIAVKARSIAPSGKITEVGREQVKEIKNSEGVPEYLLAVEGIEKGGEVELLYTEKRPFSSFGSENFQFSLPVMKASFMLILPTRLVFDTKGYNGFPSAKDSISSDHSDVHFYTSHMDGIPGIKEEEYSNYKANIARFDYKLSYVKGDNSDVRQLTWSELANNLYEKYYSFTDKEKRAALDYTTETIGVKESDDEVTKIEKIEDYLKTNIAMSEDLKDEDAATTTAFSTIMDKKLTTETGFVRFFVACLSAAGVKHELGIGSSQYEHPLDDSLELWSGLDIFALYFPKESQYISPSAINMRYPLYPIGLIGAKVVFAKTTTLGNMTKALPDIRTLPALPYEMSDHNIDAAITFAPDMTPQIDLSYSFLGYGAVGLREVFIYSPKEKEPELLRNIISLAAKPEDVKSSGVTGAAFSNYSSGKPLSLNMNLVAPALMEKAGPKYLFKVGDVIGRQVEMYSDEKRVLPIDMQYAHQDVRNISITIPQGYKVVNPEAVKMQVRQDYNGQPASAFLSDYKMEGNVMKIHIQEYYRQLRMPASEFEAFRKVVNAAADFNKVVLVLQKN